SGSAWLLPAASTTLQRVEGNKSLRVSPFPTRVFTLSVCTNTAEEKQAARKIQISCSTRSEIRLLRGNSNTKNQRKNMILLTEFKEKTASAARLLTAAMTLMLLLSILAHASFGGRSNGVLNFGKTPSLVRQPSITTFDAPESGTAPSQGTIAFAINPSGTISGRYADAAGAIHAILRYPNGAIISFDAPGAGTGLRQGTRPFSINPAGTTAGYYNDASGVFHGFLRTPAGAITTFDI